MLTLTDEWIRFFLKKTLSQAEPRHKELPVSLWNPRDTNSNALKPIVSLFNRLIAEKQPIQYAFILNFNGYTPILFQCNPNSSPIFYIFNTFIGNHTIPENPIHLIALWLTRNFPLEHLKIRYLNQPIKKDMLYNGIEALSIIDFFLDPTREKIDHSIKKKNSQLESFTPNPSIYKLYALDTLQQKAQNLISSIDPELFLKRFELNPQVAPISSEDNIEYYQFFLQQFKKEISSCLSSSTTHSISKINAFYELNFRLRLIKHFSVCSVNDLINHNSTPRLSRLSIEPYPRSTAMNTCVISRTKRKAILLTPNWANQLIPNNNQTSAQNLRGFCESIFVSFKNLKKLKDQLGLLPQNETNGIARYFIFQSKDKKITFPWGYFRNQHEHIVIMNGISPKKCKTLKKLIQRLIKIFPNSRICYLKNSRLLDEEFLQVDSIMMLRAMNKFHLKSDLIKQLSKTFTDSTNMNQRSHPFDLPLEFLAFVQNENYFNLSEDIIGEAQPTFNTSKLAMKKFQPQNYEKNIIQKAIKLSIELFYIRQLNCHIQSVYFRKYLTPVELSNILNRYKHESTNFARQKDSHSIEAYLEQMSTLFCQTISQPLLKICLSSDFFLKQEFITQKKLSGLKM